jgi:hypothetical protein
MGGWWAGRTVSEAATRITKSDDDYYRKHYETSPSRLADRKFEDVQPAYHLGHVAAHNPDYATRDWDAVETDLRRGWTSDASKRYGEWDRVRDYAREGYTRGRSTATASGAERTVDRSEGMVDRAGDAMRNAGRKVANAVDDVKDRVDGNPASRPGPDPTDRRF